MAKTKRTAAEVAQQILNAEFGDQSDIEDLSDEDDDQTQQEEIEVEEETVVEIEIDESSSEEENQEPVAKKPTKKQPVKKKVSWVKKRFISSAPLETIEDLPLSDPLSPYSYFKEFIPNSLLEEFSEKTNMYYFQNTGKDLKVTGEEIKTLFGIHVEMGSAKFPTLRTYWSKARRYNLIADAMTFNRFSVLRNNLHCVDNLQDNNRDSDKFWKIRPIMKQSLNVMLQQQPEKNVCVDEQIIPFKGRLGLKQYMKGKPNPWGVKIFFLCGESGMPYNFVAYQGKTTSLPQKHLPLGLSGAIVMSLVEGRLIHCSDYRLFFDNFFTSPALVQQLLPKGIYCTGTVRNNRVGSLPIKTNAELTKEGRGAMDGCTSRDKKMGLVRWNDNSVVTVISSAYDWENEQGNVTRYVKSAKEYIQIPCPLPILKYNKSMGGVDKLDFLISLYRIHIKSKKWTLRIIFHFVDVAVVSSWLKYKKDCKSIGMRKSEQLSLLQFRYSIAECLIQCGTNPTARVLPGRPVRRSYEHQPQSDVRFDGIGHLPVWNEKRQRCKNADCIDTFSHFVCVKCKVSLCLNKHRNCFFNYHSLSPPPSFQ